MSELGGFGDFVSPRLGGPLPSDSQLCEACAADDHRLHYRDGACSVVGCSCPRIGAHNGNGDDDAPEGV